MAPKRHVFFGRVEYGLKAILGKGSVPSLPTDLEVCENEHLLLDEAAL